MVEQPARVVAQVENHPDELVARLLLEALHRVVEAGIGLLIEGRYPDVTDIVALEMGAHRLYSDRRSDQLDIEGIAPLAPDRQLDLAADRTAHFFNRFRQGHPLHRIAVEMGLG